VPERLVPAIRAAAAGDGTVPPDLLGRLLEQIGRLQRQVLSPRGLTFGGLTDREVKVLKLVADGWDTAEIADDLSYSERTVKNIIHDVTSRLQLRNRSHAVAYALRQGLI
jgi:DNA-binding NarL/FixJ family response regulator